MTRAERLAALLEQLVTDGRLYVDVAADRHGVSPATVRRDVADPQTLDALRSVGIEVVIA